MSLLYFTALFELRVMRKLQIYYLFDSDSKWIPLCIFTHMWLTRFLISNKYAHYYFLYIIHILILMYLCFTLVGHDFVSYKTDKLYNSTENIRIQITFLMSTCYGIHNFVWICQQKLNRGLDENERRRLITPNIIFYVS